MVKETKTNCMDVLKELYSRLNLGGPGYSFTQAVDIGYGLGILSFALRPMLGVMGLGYVDKRGVE